MDEAVSVPMLLFFLHKRPLLVKLDRSGSQVLDLLSVEALRIAATGFEQSGPGFLSYFGQSCGRSRAAPFVKMINDFIGFGFTNLGIEQGRVASCRELF